jgi:hypothetical protein
VKQSLGTKLLHISSCDPAQCFGFVAALCMYLTEKAENSQCRVADSRKHWRNRHWYESSWRSGLVLSHTQLCTTVDSQKRTIQHKQTKREGAAPKVNEKERWIQPIPRALPYLRVSMTSLTLYPRGLQRPSARGRRLAPALRRMSCESATTEALKGIGSCATCFT